jgi:hypothetical protein
MSKLNESNELIKLFNTTVKKRVVNKFNLGYELLEDCTKDTNYSYIDMHGYNTLDYICIDYDHQTLNGLYDLAHYPEPNIIIQSLSSNKFHLVYLLNTPVYKNGNPGPLKLFNEIKHKLTHLLEGDKSYNNVFMYNLFNTDEYHTHINNYTKYNLSDFYEYFDVEDFKPTSRVSTCQYEYDMDEYEVFPVGMRNTLLFQEMRRYAYSNYIPSHKLGFDLLDRVSSYGIKLNEELCEVSLTQNAIISIANSIIRFIIRTFSHAEYKRWIAENYSSERQAFRGHRKNLSTRLQGELYILDRLLLDNKPNAQTISNTFNCTLRTAYRWISRCKSIRKDYDIWGKREDVDYERDVLLKHISSIVNPLPLIERRTSIPQHFIDAAVVEVHQMFKDSQYSETYDSTTGFTATNFINAKGVDHITFESCNNPAAYVRERVIKIEITL